MHVTPSATDAKVSAAPVFEHYSSVISRAIGGIPVAESFAWAIINANGAVVEESVYWPDVAASAVSDARTLVATLADSIAGPAYRALLPKDLPSGNVVIHHTPCIGGINEARATYDVPDHGSVVGMGRTRHFDLQGKEVVLLAESTPVLPNTPNKPMSSNVTP